MPHLLLAFLAALLNQADGGSPQLGNLVIDARGFTSSAGHALARLYRPGMSVTGDPAVMVAAPIVDGRARLEFPQLPAGDYAVVVVHDLNDNRRIDHSLGFPAEPLGFTNGFRLGLFSGMPSFAKLRVTLDGPLATYPVTVR